MGRSYHCGGWASYTGPCGADDCLDCHPENFRRIDGRWVYIEPEEDEDEDDEDDS